MPEEDALAAKADAESNGRAAPLESDDKPLATVRELHENKEIAPIIDQLAEMAIDIDDYGLVQEEAVTGEKLPTKYAWAMQKKQSARAPTTSRTTRATRRPASHRLRRPSRRRRSPTSSRPCATSVVAAWRSSGSRVWARWTPSSSGRPRWTSRSAR
ncbi:MAG: hypothetical protein ACFHWZ_05795 [Phycisphaerales bacterium]